MMRLLVIVVFSLFTIHLSAATYYVAPANATPAGNDAAAGDKSHPWASWEKAFTSRKPGDTIIFRGGVYPTTVTSGAGITKTVTGTADKWVVFMNYPGEVPVLDCSNITSTWYGNTYGLKLSGSYYKLIGLTIRNVWQIDPANPADETYAFRTSGDNYTLERCTAHSTHGSGFFPSGSNVRITNCDSYDHCDSLSTSLPGNDGYGYFHYNTGTTGSIYYKDCRAWDNGDDGWALADNSYVEIDGCWSFNNGRMEGAGNGFKIGFIPQKASVPLLRVVKNSIAAFNRASGLTTNDNNDYTIAPSQIYNNVAFHNGYYSEWNNPVYGFYLYSTNGTDQEELQRILRNNISYKNQGGAVGDGYYHDVLFTHSHNSWDISGLTVADADFMSVDSTGISGPRQADGSLPALNFLKLASSSKLIDKGVDVGLPYTGSAPDLGIAEASATATAPVARITAPATTILTCTTLSITLTATGGATYSWSDGTRVVGTSGTLTVSAPGNYTVTVTSSDGLTDTETIAITSNTTPPVVTLTNTTGTTVLTCATPSISVTAGGGVSYSWHDGSKVVATTASLAITTPATYTVTATGANGCTATKAITITQNKTAPAVTLTNTTGTTTLTCATPSISVTAGGGVSYSWHDGSKVVATTATLNITTPATYTVTATGANGCTATKAITITQDKTAPTVTLTNTTGTTILTCATPSISVTAGGGVSYSWHDGTKVVATTATINITAPATYTVTVTSSTGCTATKAITITQDKTAPAVTLTNTTGTTILTCATPSISVTAGGGVSYSWYDGTKVVATTATLTITAPATYTVTVTSSTGCTATKAITIIQDKTAPAVTLTNTTGTTILTCATPSITVTAGGGVSYSWHDGTKVVATTATINITAPATYTVTVTSSTGCTATKAITITQDQTVPVVTLTNTTGTTILTCATPSITVTAGGGVSYSWHDGTKVVATTATLNITAPATYTVTVSSSTGCTATKSITTTQDKTAPVVTLTNQTGTTVLSATTPSVTIIAGGGISYSWHNGTQVVATTAALTITASATYTVTVTGSNGCTSTKAITITREADTPAAPVATVTQPGCGESGGSIQFTSPLPGTGYFYSINGTDYTNTTGWFSNVPQGSYNLSVKSSAGMVSPTTPVTIQQAPIQPAAPTASVTQQPSCAVNTGTIVVSSPVGGAGYTYSIDGVSYGTASTFTGLVSGSYQVTVRYGTTGCISPATALTVNPAPDDNVQPVFPTFGPYSEGSASVVLPVVSDNGIRGSWSPATVSTATPGSFLYTFTPDPGQCATILTVTIKILVVEVTGETQLRRVISSGSDDVEETSRGTVVINSPDIELVYDNLLTGNQMVGFRFNNITIPAGATITRAYIQFSVAETTYGTTSLRIYGQKSEHAGVFTTARRGVSKRPRTTASVAWSPTPSGGSAVGSRGVGQQTPDLAPLMQEILSLSGWQPGNSMAFIINGYGKRNAVAYEGSKTNAAELVVEYIEPAATASATLVTKKALLPTAAGQEAGLTCYPVPFGETLHINILQGTQEQPRMMGLFDLSGRKVKSLDHTATTQSVATGDLPPGVYLLRMVTDKNEIVKKIIKQ